VRQAKGELYDFLRANDGTAFVMWDYDYLQQMSQGVPHIVRYGTGSSSDIVGHVIQSEPYLTVGISKGADISEIKTQLVGNYNLPNILAAVAAGKHFGVSDEKIKQAIEAYAPSNSRSQLIKQNSNHIILDAYNANPTSMRAAIENFASLQAKNKVLVLGGMMELGAESIQEHIAIVELIKKYPWNEVVLVGGDFLKIDHPFTKMNNSTEAAEWFKQKNFHDTYLLIKGSRSMQMEKVLS
jgi:UDP-N-acetylmuramoyl-tripeptide--D-alanyl-D-alanine ligase